MKSRNGNLLSILVFLILMVPIFYANLHDSPQFNGNAFDIEINEGDGPIATTVPQDHGTRASVIGEGSVMDEEFSNLVMQFSPYYYSTIGWEFDVNRVCTVTQLGAFKNSEFPYQYYNMRIWNSAGTILVQVTNPDVLNKNWTWIDIPPISLSPGSYVISAYVRGRNMSAINNPGPTSDGVINPIKTKIRNGNAFPWTDLGNTHLPMIDFRYTYTFTPDIIVPDDYVTIQEAIDAANIDDTIYVLENVFPYNEELIIAKTIKLIGENSATTIIDSTGVTGGTGVTILITGNDVLLSGFTVTGGDCGIYCDSTEGTDIRHSIISQNNDYGIYLDNSQGTTIKSNSIFANNQDMDADGFGIYILDSHVSGIRYNVISYNKVGIKIIDSIIEGCLNWNTFVGNEIAVDYDPEPLEIDGNIFIDNFVAIKISGDDSLLVITNNMITGSEIGIYIETGSPLIESNTFTDNRYAIYYLPDSSPVINDNTFIDNEIDIYSEILVDMNVDPDTLNLKSRGRWITVCITLPEGFDVEDIDPCTIILGDGTFELGGEHIEFESIQCIVKFDRSDLEDLIGAPNQEYELIVSGELLDGTPFSGSDTIRVICPGR
jgi:parallel beta-helix repeat protein